MPDSAEQWVCVPSAPHPEHPFSIIKGSDHQLFRLLTQLPQKAPAAYLQWFRMFAKAPAGCQYLPIPTNTPQYPTNTLSKARPIPSQYPRALQLCVHFLLIWLGALCRPGLTFAVQRSSRLSDGLPVPSTVAKIPLRKNPYLGFLPV